MDVKTDGGKPLVSAFCELSKMPQIYTVVIMLQYNSSITKNEEQKKCILRLVYHHRKTYLSCCKVIFMKMDENSD